jgi:hypothetical protein
MSTMAGFDLVIEVAKETVLRLIQANVSIADTPLIPPFGVDVPIALGTDSYAAVIVTGMSADLVGDQGINVVLKFENTSLISKAPALAITLLDGTVTIGAALQLIDYRGPKKALMTDLGAATASIAFSDAAKTRIAAGLAGLPLNAAQLIAVANAAMESFVRAAGRQIIPSPTFTVMPGVIGSISQGRFERLVLHNIAGRAVGLFGMLIPEKPLGNPADKNTSAIPPGQNLCIEIGAEAFHRLIFCANLAGPGGVAALPPTCGAGTLDQGGVTFTNLSDTFGFNRIDINGTFTKSGFCYDATGSVHGTVTLSLSKAGGASVVKANVAIDDPAIDVDVPWYCTLAEVLLGPIGLIMANAIQSSATSSAGDLQSAVSGLTGGGLAFGSGGLSGTVFNQVSIEPEAIILAGTVNVYLPPPQKPDLRLIGSVTTSDRQQISSGVYVVPDGCLQGSYPYLEFSQAQSGTYLVLPTLLGKPLALEWHLECWQGYWGYGSSPKQVSSAMLGGSAGGAVLTGVTTSFPLPLPGGASIVQNVHVSYVGTSNTIKLANASNEGNYGFILTVKATDPAGTVMTAQKGVGFEGDVVTILGGYQEKAAECLREFMERLKRIGIEQHVEIPPWVPVNYPDPAELVEVIRVIASVGTEEADRYTLTAKLVHGASYLRALGSRAAVDGKIGAAGSGIREE